MRQRLFLAILCIGIVTLCQGSRDEELQARAGQKANKSSWRLEFEENFEQPMGGETAPWIKVAPEMTDPFDDDGSYFHAIGGTDFVKQLESFDTYRKTFRFGKEGWLTAELSARDPDKQGRPKNPPSLTNAKIGGESIGLLREPDHHGGILVRSTRPLPVQYRIEYSLVAIDFGGSRHGLWNNLERLNGYAEKEAKTRHPWPFHPSDEISKPYADWLDVRFANGFYFLAIVDYQNPFPRNNVFIHTHRKVVMDSYNVDEKATFETCNPIDKKYYISQDNTVNMLFLSPGEMRESQSVAETECGTNYGVQNGHSPVVSAVQLQPELMPAQKYRFAIERDETGYTLEIKGNFRFVGEQTYRYHRAFLQDRHPIWHYNQTSEEYDGSYDNSWTYEGPFGKVKMAHTWPKDSAYPDFFIIGDPHTNYYEGSAAITNIKLYSRDGR
jgi:hypothetical protein